MDFIRSWPAKQRAQHYLDEARKFRQLADAEPVEDTRTQLLLLAQQYQELATSLGDDAKRTRCLAGEL